MNFFFIFFRKKISFPKKKKKKDPSTNDFSYQKYINGSMATQREKTHIQYPNIYKLYVSINYIYTKMTFFLSFLFFLYLIYFVVPATQTGAAQCNRRPTSGGTVCWVNDSSAGGHVLVAWSGGFHFYTSSSFSSSSFSSSSSTIRRCLHATV